MKRQFLSLLLMIPLTLCAQEVQNTVAGLIDYNSGKVISLLEAIPEDKFSWNPSDDVRSIGGAALHIAGGNYFFGMLLGAQIPEGVDPMSLESTVTGKENIIEAVKKSYEFISATVKSVPESTMNDELKFPDGTPMSKRGMLMVAFGHCEEHMGQLVAYARSNEIAPPWSQGN